MQHKKQATQYNNMLKGNFVYIFYFNFPANEDQHAATEEKTVLEEAQRAKARELKATGLEHTPRFFEHDGNSYVYKHSDYR